MKLLSLCRASATAAGLLLATGTLQAQTVADLTGAADIAAGANHACVVTSAGRVKCWGANTGGQLGDGTFTDRLTPVFVDFGPGVTLSKVAVGFQHSCAITSAGGVRCWGDNGWGQLGNNSQESSAVPVTVDLGGATASGIAAGGTHTCAATSAGVRCWGSNVMGELGQGTTFQQLQLSTIPLAVALANGATAGSIATGLRHTCVVTALGGAQCWGDNTFGQGGDGTQGNSKLVPTAVSLGATPVANISAGATHTCAITTSDTLKCWGSNAYGQLGDGTFIGKATPADILLVGANVTSLGAGEYHTCVSFVGGGVKCWGLNSSNAGQVGDGTTGNVRPTPIDVNLNGSAASKVAAGGSFTCAVTTAGGARCWGSNRFGQLGTNEQAVRLMPAAVALAGSAQAASVSAGNLHSCALTPSGGVQCWGLNNNGQLGDGSVASSATPVTANLGAGVVATSVAAGGLHTCALISTGGVKCWGGNADGQYGNGTQISGLSAVDVALPAKAVAISAGLNHNCAIVTGGGVYCWGANESGQVGNGSTVGQTSPVLINLSGASAIAIATGLEHTCAVTSTGGVLCWGENGNGELGTGDTTPSLLPVVASVAPAGAVSVGVGRDHTCVLTGAGAVRCWGSAQFGQLGHGTSISSLSAVTANLGSGATALASTLSVGDRHSCARLAGGAVKCWGYSPDGRLGDGTESGGATPVDATLGAIATSVSAGGSHSCGVINGGMVKCWGSSFQGQLGLGSFGFSASPVTVLQRSVRVSLQLEGSGSGTVTSNPAGMNCPPTCSVEVPEGTVATLSASPAGGSVFASWAGSGCSGTAACDVRALGMKSVRATFSSTQLPLAELTVSRAGAGTGFVTSTPAGLDCGIVCTAGFTPGTSVTLAASPLPGSTFAGWSGACSGTGPCVVPLSSATTAVATFNGAMLPFRTLTSQTIGASQFFLTRGALTVGLGTTVASPAEILYLAGERVLFVPVFRVAPGAKLEVIIDPTLVR